jgi:hypothetical protein
VDDPRAAFSAELVVPDCGTQHSVGRGELAWRHPVAKFAVERVDHIDHRMSVGVAGRREDDVELSRVLLVCSVRA